jgi:hypothetical protein
LQGPCQWVDAVSLGRRVPLLAIEQASLGAPTLLVKDVTPTNLSNDRRRLGHVRRLLGPRHPEHLAAPGLPGVADSVVDFDVIDFGVF